MRNLSCDLQSAGGIASVRRLRFLGHSRHRIATALATHEVIRPRIGWIALPNADAAAIRAVALGGRLASGNALAARGIWVDQLVGLSVHVPPNASRLPPLAPGERRTCRRLIRAMDATTEWCVSVPDALIQLSYEAEPVPWLTSVDSSLQHGAMDREVLEVVARGIPADHRKVLALADGRAQSGNETRFRVMLIREGFGVQIQAKIALVGWVDLLVDGWLIVEIDSREHHDRISEQERDRIRDGNALLLGFATLRFMPEAVRDASGWCLEVVRARLRHGRPLHGSPSHGQPPQGSPSHVWPPQGTGLDAAPRRVSS